MDVFREKVAVVTGGASGIGEALSRELARRGAVVVVADINGARAEGVAASLRASGSRATSAPLDVRDAPAFEALLDAVIADHGHLDFVFNNAGIAIGGEERDVTSEDWQKVLDIDLHGVVHGSRAAYARMVKQGSGHIVNTASAAGLVPLAGELSYSTAKYGVVGLSHGLRIEGAALGVKVSVVCPGFVETPILDSPLRGPHDREKLRSIIPKPMPPSECAKQVLDGVARNKATIVITWHAKILWALTRLSPDATIWLGAKIMARMRDQFRRA